MQHLLVVIITGALLITIVLCSLRQAEAAPAPGIRIRVSTNDQVIVFALNDSQAARDLVAQLPLAIDVENYGRHEKIFYPPRKLSTEGTPLAKNVQPGTLCYYAPWADVVMFYGSFGSASGLYELGHAIEGAESIRTLNGVIAIEAKTSR